MSDTDRSMAKVSLYTTFIILTLVVVTICAGFNVAGYYLVVSGLTGPTQGKKNIEIFAEISNFLIFIFWTYILVFTIITLASKRDMLWNKQLEGIHFNTVMQIFCVFSLVISIIVFILMILAIVNTKNALTSTTTTASVGWYLWIFTTIFIGFAFIFTCVVWYTLVNGRDKGYYTGKKSQELAYVSVKPTPMGEIY